MTVDVKIAGELQAVILDIDPYFYFGRVGQEGQERGRERLGKMVEMNEQDEGRRTNLHEGNFGLGGVAFEGYAPTTRKDVKD